MKEKNISISAVVIGVIIFLSLFLAFEFFWASIHIDLALFKTRTIIIASGLSALGVYAMVIMIILKKKKSFILGMSLSILISSVLIFIYSEFLTPFSLRMAREKEKKNLIRLIQETFGNAPTDFQWNQKK